MGPASQNPSRPRPIPPDPQTRRPARSKRRLLRRTHQCSQTTSRSRPSHWRKDQVHRRDVPLPVGQQNARIPRRSPPGARQPRRSRHQSLLRNGHRRHSPSERTLPPRSPPQTQRQTHVPTLPGVSGRGDAQTPLGKITLLSTLVRTMHPSRDLVHPRTPESRRHGIHAHQNPRSASLPARAT